MPANPSEVSEIDHLHQKAKTLIQQDKSEQEILQQLEEEGIEKSYAQLILENCYNDIHDRKGFWKLLFSGIFFTLAGLAINYLSYKIADNANSLLFYLFWGIVVFGVVLIFRAFIIFKK